MRPETLEPQHDESPVESCVRPRCQNVVHELSGEHRSDQSLRNIHQVRAAKLFHQRVALVRQELVVLENHFGNLGSPCALTRARQVSPGKPDGRRNIVECIVGPDTKVMKRCCESNLVQVYRAVCRQGDAEIHDAIGMIPIRRKIIAEFSTMGIQHLVKNRNVSNQIHFLVLPISARNSRGSCEPLDELESLHGDFPPAGVDRQRVPAARHLGDLGHARVALLPFVGRVRDRPRDRMVGVGRDD
jgi:hypothetical protein